MREESSRQNDAWAVEGHALQHGVVRVLLLLLPQALQREHAMVAFDNGVGAVIFRLLHHDEPMLDGEVAAAAQPVR